MIQAQAPRVAPHQLRDGLSAAHYAARPWVVQRGELKGRNELASRDGKPNFPSWGARTAVVQLEGLEEQMSVSNGRNIHFIVPCNLALVGVADGCR